MSQVRVGLLGIGTVGSGVWRVLQRNADEIARRAGRPIEIVAVADRNVERAQEIVGREAIERGVVVTAEAAAVVARPDVEIVVELIGGTSAAKALVKAAIAAGKHVVTANKALLAEHGGEIFAAAQERGVMVGFEAAVAGGIPIIKALREGLAANRIEWVAGIINGTTNYILTQMQMRGIPFAEALREAQALGYAEADPTLDVEGIDAAHKATLLASLAFGVPIQFERAYVEGISAVEARDIAYADALGYRVKLLAVARRRADGFELRVHPTLIPKEHLLANVNGAMNAVVVKGDAVGQTLYYGAGAGSEPTASAVIADLVEVARLMNATPSQRVPHLAFQPGELVTLPVLPIGACRTSFYLRLQVADEVGVLAQLARVLADEGVSIAAVIQKEDGVAEKGIAELVLLTHESEERRVRSAIARIEQQVWVRGRWAALRVEHLQ
ncbi:MAG: homoserine dehydrogenase [Hydrogenophilus sp.]|nr:homoserine dehydrogenase [Hydrogenophilus sp.]